MKSDGGLRGSYNQEVSSHVEASTKRKRDTAVVSAYHEEHAQCAGPQEGRGRRVREA